MIAQKALVIGFGRGLQDFSFGKNTLSACVLKLLDAAAIYRFSISALTIKALVTVQTSLCL
ncbi:hypothetical protein [Duganella vulcania]|uniref:Uncharacterized protein n=1 Tax=Duganella vulcania TaxID=2692166 RepID=A0A845GFR8_9BURK|nr:hypothetical protein [Duganella vulcania]MYM92791.1 hypothetical protein [Duganella vulcania]